MKLVNRCPHHVRLIRMDGTSIDLAPESPAIRLEVVEEVAGYVEDVPIVVVRHVLPALPPPGPGTLLIVSSLVRAAFPNRRDLVSPAKQTYDENRVVTGCCALSANSLK